MSSPDFTPPGPPIEPFQGHFGTGAAPPPSTAPGAAWPGQYYVSVRRPGGLAISGLVLAGGVALVNVLMALTSVLMQNRDRDDSLVFGIIGYGLLAAVMLALLLAAYIVTCLWLVQCRKFADAYRPGDEHRHGNTWVWLGWWVPIACVFVPCQVVRDRYRAARPRHADSGLVSLWWFLWLVYYVVSGAGRDSADGLPNATSDVVSAVVSVAALICWAIIIRRIDSGQQDQELAGPPR